MLTVFPITRRHEHAQFAPVCFGSFRCLRGQADLGSLFPFFLSYPHMESTQACQHIQTRINNDELESSFDCASFVIFIWGKKLLDKDMHFTGCMHVLLQHIQATKQIDIRKKEPSFFFFFFFPLFFLRGQLVNLSVDASLYGRPGLLQQTSDFSWNL